MAGTLYLQRARTSLRRVGPGEVQRISHAIAQAEQIEAAAAARARTKAQVRGFWLQVGLIVAIACRVIFSNTIDPDAFWHLRVAEQLRHEGIRPLVDQISFASSKTPWTPYSWLAELLMLDIWTLGGHHAATLVTAACGAGVLIFTARACRARTDNLLAALLCTIAAAWLILPYLSFRPVTFALLLFAIVIDLLARQPNRAIWMIPPIVLLMTNLHLYAAVCAAAVVLVAIASCWDDRPNCARNLLLAGLTIAAACGTPMLGGAVDTALRYNAADPMVAAHYITEMRPFWWGIDGKLSLSIVIGCAVLLIVRRKQAKVADWLLVVLATGLIFRLGRFAPVYAILALPCIAPLLPAMSVRAIGRPTAQALVGIVLVTSAALLWRDYPRSMPLDEWLNRTGPAYPVAAARFVDEHVIPRYGRLINEFNWGGYLAWRLGDRYQVLMDGRTQLYPPEFWHATHLCDATSRAALLRTIEADAAILPTGQSAFAPVLKELGWRITHQDDTAIVMIP